MGLSGSSSLKPLAVENRTKLAATETPCDLTAAEKRARSDSVSSETSVHENSAGVLQNKTAVSGTEQTLSSQAVTRAMSMPAGVPSVGVTDVATADDGSAKQHAGWINNMTEEHWERLNMMCIVTPSSL